MSSTVFAVGLGARRGVEPAALASFVRAQLAAAGLMPTGAPLYTLVKESDAAAFEAVAALLETRVTFLPAAALKAREAEALTRSPRVEALFGVASVAELAALVGAGPGSALLGPRVAAARYTLAIARAGSAR
jgi:cobalt-precorrin 5A hydrolase